MATCTVETGNSSGLNVRASKSTSSTRLGIIANGTLVNVVCCDGTWATLVYDGTPAFVMHTYLDGPPTTYGEGLSAGDSATCNANNVNIRSTANGSTTGDQLDKGDNVTIYDRSSIISSYYWYRIGTNKWVRGDFLAPGSTSSGGNAGDVGTPTILQTFSTGTVTGGATLYIGPSTSYDQDGAIGTAGGSFSFSTFSGTNITGAYQSWLVYMKGTSYRYVRQRDVVGGQYTNIGTVATVSVNDELNLRDLPSTNAEIIDTLPNGTAVRVAETYGLWKRVLTPYGMGWVFHTYLSY